MNTRRKDARKRLIQERFLRSCFKDIIDCQGFEHVAPRRSPRRYSCDSERGLPLGALESSLTGSVIGM